MDFQHHHSIHYVTTRDPQLPLLKVKMEEFALHIIPNLGKLVEYILLTLKDLSVIFRIPTAASISFSNFNPNYRTFNHSGFGPTFGNDNNAAAYLFISNACNLNTNSYSSLGKCYRGAGASDTCLFGSRNFQVEEYEVYGMFLV